MILKYTRIRFLLIIFSIKRLYKYNKNLTIEGKFYKKIFGTFGTPFFYHFINFTFSEKVDYQYPKNDEYIIKNICTFFLELKPNS